jgi:hypothetical protein
MAATCAQLPAYVVADNAQDLLPAVLPALLGGLAGLAFVTLLPCGASRARCGAVRYPAGSLAFAALATAWPILQPLRPPPDRRPAGLGPGRRLRPPAAARAEGAGAGAVPGLGWRGGAIFRSSSPVPPAAARPWPCSHRPTPPWRWWRASRRPPRWASASPRRRCSSSPC